MPELISGYSFTNGLVFMSDNGMQARLECAFDPAGNITDSDIVYEKSSINSVRNFIPIWIESIPIVRSVAFLIQVLVSASIAKPRVAIGIALINLMVMFKPFDRFGSTFAASVDKHRIDCALWIIAALILIILMANIKKWFSFVKRALIWHGVEHKIIRCNREGNEISMANVRQTPRFSIHCGSRLVIYILFPVLIVSFLFPGFPLWPILILFTDLYLCFSERDDFFSRWFQNTFFTIEPPDEYLSEAINMANKLLSFDATGAIITKL